MIYRNNNKTIEKTKKEKCTTQVIAKFEEKE
jgi:hypothetical protein